MKDYLKIFHELLEITISNKASDLHLSSNRKPIIRISGRLGQIEEKEIFSAKDLFNLVQTILPKEKFAKLLQEKEVDFSYPYQAKGRFRGNAYFQQESVSCVLRFIRMEIPTPEELNLPPILHLFTRATQGLVLVTGPSNQGKSTTLASLIDEINHTRADHVITIEDPIEYLFEDDLSVIDQREVGIDTRSFAKALRSTFRQDPNVIMLGEMRDPETISTAVTAAETGHLVFATLHTNSAAQTIHRIVDSFSGARQIQVRAQLSGSLLGIVSQRLVPRNGGGLIPVAEIMLNTPAIANLIRENKIHEIPLVITTSLQDGMMSLNQSIAILVKEKKISAENAYNFSPHPQELKELLKR